MGEMKWALLSAFLVIAGVVGVSLMLPKYRPDWEISRQIAGFKTWVNGKIGGEKVEDTSQEEVAQENVDRGVTPAAVSPTAAPRGGSTPAASKKYAGKGFELTYPSNWAVLTCANTTNFEFNPDGGSDKVGVRCDWAQWPVTVLLQPEGYVCRGEVKRLGKVETRKTREEEKGIVYFTWCTQTTPKLEISHRVNMGTEKMTTASQKSYESEVEAIIASWK